MDWKYRMILENKYRIYHDIYHDIYSLTHHQTLLISLFILIYLSILNFTLEKLYKKYKFSTVDITVDTNSISNLLYDELANRIISREFLAIIDQISRWNGTLRDIFRHFTGGYYLHIGLDLASRYLAAVVSSLLFHPNSFSSSERANSILLLYFIIALVPTLSLQISLQLFSSNSS